MNGSALAEVELFTSLVTELAASITAAEWAAFLSLDRRTGDLVITNSTAQYRERKGMTFAVREFAGLASQVVIERKSLLVDDVHDEQWRSWYHQMVPGIRSALLVPLSLDSRITGVLATESKELAHFNETHKSQLSLLGDIAAQIVHQLEVNASLQAVASSILSGASLDDVFRMSLKTAYDLTGAHSASIRTLDAGKGILEVRERIGDKGPRSSDAIPCDAGIVGLAWQKRTFVLVDDVSEWGEPYLPFNARTRSELAVPVLIRADEDPVGVLNLEHHDPAHFDALDARPLTDLGLSLAFAVTADQRYRESLKSQQLAIGASIAAALAHPINSFLQAVSGNLDVLGERIKADDVNGRVALEAVQRDVRLTNDRANAILLQIRAPEPDWIDIQGLLIETIRDVEGRRPTFVDPPVAQLPDSLPKVWMDKRQLRAILENLITNSYEALESEHDDKPGKIGKLRVVAELGRDDRLRMAFHDNGPGFDEYAAENVFRNPVTEKDVDDHFGVGLWLAKRVLEFNGGDIYAPDPPPESGATVIVVLPTSLKD
jgi:signal transduction histidine kinase